MQAVAAKQGWDLNYGGIALMWRGGCIIRSAFLGKIKEAFDAKFDLVNLLLDPFFRQAIETAQAGWRRVTAAAVVITSYSIHYTKLYEKISQPFHPQ